MNDLTTTYNFNGFNVRVYGTVDNPLFVAKDICEAIGISNTSDALQMVDVDDLAKGEVVDSAGRRKETNLVTESGMYTLVLRSNKPEAKVFRKWVTSEVLPAIRKHGMYATDMTIDKFLDDPDFALKTMLRYKEERILRIEAERKAEESRKELEVAQPILLFHEELKSNDQHFTLSAVCKIICDNNGYDIGKSRLVDILRSDGLIMKKSYEPTQKAVNENILAVKSEWINKKLKLETVITMKGTEYIMSKLQNKSCDFSLF